MSSQKGGKRGRRGPFPVRIPCERLEPRAFLAAVVGDDAVFGLVGGRAVPAHLVPAPGSRVILSLKGPGVGTATLRDGRVDIVFEGTTGASAALVRSAGRFPVTLGNVIVRGPLGVLKAPGAAASGAFTFEGPVGQLALGSGRDLTIDAPGHSIGSIAVNRWADDESTGKDRITAASLGSLRVGTARGGRASRGAAAEFDADLDVGRLGVVAVAGNATFDARVQFADSISVAGDLSDSSITVMPAADGQDAGLGRLSVGKSMAGVKVVAMGDVGAVTAGTMSNSDVMAGVRYGTLSDGSFEHVLPAEGHTKDFDFTGQYHIGRVAVTGIEGERQRARRQPGLRFAADLPVAPAPAPAWFSNSRVAAYDVGEVTLERVGGYNAARPYGVAAYRIGSVVRHFADPASPGSFVVRQTLEPLIYREGPDGHGAYYGAGYGAISIVDNVIGGVFLRFNGGATELPYINIPATGAAIGSAQVNGESATLFLMPDGAYEVRGSEAAPLARDASLAALVQAVAGTPGTAMKVVHRPAATASDTDGSAHFLSTSVGGSVTVTLRARPKPYRWTPPAGDPVILPIGPGGMPVAVPGAALAPTDYTLPTFGEIRAALVAGGTEVRVFDRSLVLVKPEGKEVGRAYDDTGLRKILLTDHNTFRLTSDTGVVLWEGDDLAAALVGPGARLGLRRLPMRLVGKSTVFLHGLARGGTAVFAFGGQTTLDPLGNVNTLADGNGIAERLRAAGIDFTGHEL